jgi:hypothetical protein
MSGSWNCDRRRRQVVSLDEIRFVPVAAQQLREFGATDTRQHYSDFAVLTDSRSGGHEDRAGTSRQSAAQAEPCHRGERRILCEVSHGAQCPLQRPEGGYAGEFRGLSASLVRKRTEQDAQEMVGCWPLMTPDKMVC